MKYLLEATAVKANGNCEDTEIPVELNFDGDYENTSIIMFENPDYWIPISEIEELISIAKRLTNRELQ